MKKYEMARKIYSDSGWSVLFLKQNAFKLVPGSFSRFNVLEKLELKLETIIEIHEPTD